MNLWRLVFVVLLSIAIPSYGLAAMARHDDCPAHAQGAKTEKVTMSKPCCDDMGGKGEKSNDACWKPCGNGGDCRTVNLVQSSTAAQSGVKSHVTPFSRGSVRIASFEPSAVWRPPRSL